MHAALAWVCMRGRLHERGPQKREKEPPHACGVSTVRVATTRRARRRSQHAPVLKRSTACSSKMLRLKRTTCIVPAKLRTWASPYERTC